MLDLYDVGGDRWTELITLTREAKQKDWWRACDLDDRGYVPLEAEATLVRDYTLGYVPGLPQTKDYAPGAVPDLTAPTYRARAGERHRGADDPPAAAHQRRTPAGAGGDRR